MTKISVLDHGFVSLRNLSGPVRRTLKTDGGGDFLEEYPFDASDIDPAITARISFDNLDVERTKEQDIKLVEYLMCNGHNTPIEMIEIWLEMKMPIFVARQFVRHRTACINEVSARYTILPEEWYIPEKETVGFKSKSKKQGRDIAEYESLSKAEKEAIDHFITDLNEDCLSSYAKYQLHLENGIAPELARSFLHVNHYTHWVWKQDLHNMLHFLKLRLNSHAQLEAKVYAEAIYALLQQHLPETMRLFTEHRL